MRLLLALRIKWSVPVCPVCPLTAAEKTLMKATAVSGQLLYHNGSLLVTRWIQEFSSQKISRRAQYHARRQ
uniref:Uncharacterized protein n=1 Tax=Anguilla anguilla TaxID=7936 RepID=A0A0E9WBZ2_ANGAN